MEEKNKKSLDKAIQKLPSYEPDGNLWNAINKELSSSDSNTLEEAIERLPSYTPPDEVWDTIQWQLDVDTQTKAKKIRRLNWMKYAAVACVCLMSTASLFLFFQSHTKVTANDTTVRIAYSEQVIQMPKASFDDALDDTKAFNIVRQVCQQKLPVCQQAEFKELRMELKDLDIARNSLKSNITFFDTDPTHQIQLARIERNRSDVLKRIVSLI